MQGTGVVICGIVFLVGIIWLGIAVWSIVKTTVHKIIFSIILIVTITLVTLFEILIESSVVNPP
jgi:hypothetical protein